MRGSPASSVILYLISVTGMVSNAMGLITVKKTKSLHSSFGVICALLAAANFGVMAIFFAWAALPVNMAFGEDVYGGVAGKIVGQIALFFLYFCEYSHIAISFNRLVTIACPMTGSQFFTAKVTKIIVTVIFLISFAEISPYFVQEHCYFVYYYNTSRWDFSTHTACGRFCSTWLDFWSGIAIVSVIVCMDISASILFRRYLMLTSGSISAKHRSHELKLFFQSVFQAIPLASAILVYHVVGDFQAPDNEWGLFLSFTVSWGCLHAIDGVVLVLFHARPVERLLKTINQWIAARNCTPVGQPEQQQNSGTMPTTVVPKPQRRGSEQPMDIRTRGHDRF